MSSDHRATLPQISGPAAAHRQGDARRAAGRDADRAGPAGPDHLLPAPARDSSAWTQSGFFTTDPTGSFFGNPGGIRSAILGSLEIVVLATVIAIPIGIGVALYLTEYGKESLVRQHRALLRRRDDGRAVDHVRPVHLHRAGDRARRGSGFAAWKGVGGAVAADAPDRRSARPRSCCCWCRAACARPRWRWALRGGAGRRRVVLPTAAPGLVTGSLLAVARGMGETAPLLFTVSAAFGLTVQPEPADEHAAVPDLHRHHVAASAICQIERGARR